jgi:hypothetical protein
MGHADEGRTLSHPLRTISIQGCLRRLRQSFDQADRSRDRAGYPATTLVRCGRCAAVRGTLAELARRSTDVFEF